MNKDRLNLKGYVMFKKALLLSTLGASICLAVSMQNIEILNPYARATPPNTKNSAIFMDIKNNTDKPIKLIAVSSPASQIGEIHTHTKIDGMMKMIQIDNIEIPAMGEANLKPGGLHLMLINIKAPIKEGDKIDATLRFDNGDVVNLTDIPAKNVVKPGNKQ